MCHMILLVTWCSASIIKGPEMKQRNITKRNESSSATDIITENNRNTGIPPHIPLYVENPEFSGDVSIEPLPTTETPVAPMYMLDLYDQYRVNNANKPSNTVRSIQPITGEQH